MSKNRLLRRISLILVALGLCMSLGPTGVSNAAPSGESAAAACPASGQRFQIGTSDVVYLAGPDNTAYWIYDRVAYEMLWATFNGITRWPGDTVSSCYGGVAHRMYVPYLYQPEGSSRVYIHDEHVDGGYGGYRWITSAAVFNKYQFDWNRITHSIPEGTFKLWPDPWDH